MRLSLIVVLLVCWSATVHAVDAERDAKAVFARRILPIFRSPKPSSCTECHLAGVDLKNYILPSAEQTFASLRDQGLIDLEKPESSRILALIAMDPTAKDPALITDPVRAEELAAFKAWIVAGCADPALRDAPPLAGAARAQPKRPVEVIRHARQDQVLAGFEDRVWSQRFRCTSCHATDAPDAAKLIKEQGGDDFLWIRPGGAEETMRWLIEHDLVDVRQPERSQLLLKPTAKVKHAGGKKMEVGDLGYKALRSWIEEYARTVGDGYRSAKDLPATAAREHVASEIWLKLANTPPAWGERLLQVSIHAADPATRAWEKEPIAQSDRVVSGKYSLWQHSLVLAAERGSERAKAFLAQPRLPAGRYLVRVSVDAAKRVEKDWTAVMDQREYVGEVEIESAWPAGYGNMTTVDAAQVRPSRPTKR
jgi:hypothetical protein